MKVSRYMDHVDKSVMLILLNNKTPSILYNNNNINKNLPISIFDFISDGNLDTPLHFNIETRQFNQACLKRYGRNQGSLGCLVGRDFKFVYMVFRTNSTLLIASFYFLPERSTAPVIPMDRIHVNNG